MTFLPGKWLAAAALALSLALPASAAPKLAAYNAPIGESSISGISSGAFMAVQFGVAWSSAIKGIGVVAGGPYYCAKASRSNWYWFGAPIFTATGPCMKGPPGELGLVFDQVDANAASGAIDPTDHIKRQKIYVFHGYNDAVVAKSVTDGAEAFFRHYAPVAAQGNIFYQSALGAGHSYVVAQQGNPRLDHCPDNKPPYIDQCGYDQAGVVLQHIYGALNPPTAGPLTGELKSFDQSAYTGADIPSALSMGDTGYVYAPKDCEAGAACRVHVALHGCKQDAGSIQKTFVEDAGYNRWADANRIVVLYPQAETSAFLPYNPEGCWDWWSYVTMDQSYVTKSGKQIKAIKAMLDAATAGGQSAGPGVAPEAGPFKLLVNDTSDKVVALAWTAAPGAAAYRVLRSTGGGAFQPVADILGLSFADTGLTPKTAYDWQVAPVVNGAAQAPSNSVSATTLATPAACGSPGSCPVGQ